MTLILSGTDNSATVPAAGTGFGAGASGAIGSASTAAGLTGVIIFEAF